ncbi:aldose 1-epimerase family protein [Arthrobacter sp. GMC3]|uniref:aldose 1-epimerase family protein n=1 Tax=Arthrobacter sp. GMC3 TaxID=2058894 RepID=UPI000CE3CF3D|nr:aldose 1-epimerase family protein [Arthrobacter sp. GMC3]
MNGTDHLIKSGDYTARIAEQGAALRELQYLGRDLVVPFELGAPIPDYRGIIAAPWPNRIADGAYRFNGVVQHLPLNEPDRGNALHGLVFDALWEAERIEVDSVTMTCAVAASKGYPTSLDLRVTYRLDPEGLHCTVEATNSGSAEAPYGVCPHPYLLAGDSLLDDWVLQFQATSYLAVTPDRLLPHSLRPVDGHEFDFRVPRAIGATMIDHAFTGLGPAPRLVLSDPSGTQVGMSWDGGCPWLQIHTADKTDGSASRLGLAVEPMTCPPDAFNSGKDLIVLAPGATHAARWCIFGA